MKKIINGLFAFILSLLICFSFSGCSMFSSNQKKSIVCSTFAAYDWVCQILGDKSENFSLTLLTDGGVDMHSYSPSVDDILTVSNADILIYVGGESEQWIRDAVKTSSNKNLNSISLLDVLGTKARMEVVKEGMEGEEEPNKDEHVWLSVKNAQIFVKEIKTAIANLDAENAETYENNSSTYIQNLKALDNEYFKTIKSANKSTLVFGDRFPFAYLLADYSLDYFAAFLGCSAESEAKFETVVFLAEKIDELGINVILKIENSSDKLAKTIKDSTQNKNQQILTLNSMQSVKNKNAEHYLEIMTSNLEIIKTALI